MMDDASKAMLANIAALLRAGLATPEVALDLAHSLGKFDGMQELIRTERATQKALANERHVHPALAPVLDIISGKVKP